MVAVPCRSKRRSWAKLLTSRMMPMVVVATVGPTPQIHRLWSTALALDKGLVRAHIDGYFCAFVSDLATALLQNTHPDRPGKTRCSELGVATVALPRCRAEPYSLAVWYLFLGGHWHLAGGCARVCPPLRRGSQGLRPGPSSGRAKNAREQPLSHGRFC